MKVACVVCNKEIDGSVPRFNLKKYCSPECRKEYSQRRHREINPIIWDGIPAKQGISLGTVGAAGELLVAVHLMGQGHHVFRALSPSCPCDLVVLKNKKLCTIEVRKGQQNRSGTCNFSHKNSDFADYYGVMLHDGVFFVKNESLLGNSFKPNETPRFLPADIFAE